MTPAVRKGIIVALLHVAIVASLGAKLQYDRATRPRVWARAAPVDPDLPIRGRYVSLRLQGAAMDGLADGSRVPVTLQVRENRLVFLPAAVTGARLWARVSTSTSGEQVAVLLEPLAYFIPEHVPDPSVRPQGEELWVQVTLPKKGPPRPIRLGVMKDFQLLPLPF